MNGDVGPVPRALSTATLAGLLLSSAQAPLGSTMIAVALPAISRALGRDLATCTSALVTSYLIVNIIGQSPGGKLGDVLGHARAVRIGMLLQALGGVAGVFASQLGLLVASRCALALGGALVVPATMALLRTHVSADRRGRVFGLVGATMSLSAAIGPPLGGELVGRFGWRAIFFVSVPCLAIAAALLRWAPAPAPAAAEAPAARAIEVIRNFDWPGTLLLSVALGALVIGSRGAGLERMLELGFACLCTLIFLGWELRARNPILDPRLYKEARFSAPSAIVALSNFAMYGLLFALPQFFQQLRGASSKEVGRVLFPMMLAMFVTSPLGGRLNDRIGARSTGLLGLLPMVCALAWLRRLENLKAPADAVFALIVLGAGLGLSNTPAQATAMSAVAATRSGMAAGATSTMRYLGGVLSIMMLSSLLGAHAGIAAYASASTAFFVAAGLAVVAALFLPGSKPSPA